MVKSKLKEESKCSQYMKKNAIFSHIFQRFTENLSNTLLIIRKFAHIRIS